MSVYVNSSKARLWEDGDVFRAPVGTTPPANIFAASLSGWEPLGAVKVGFTLTTDRENTGLDVWNNKSGADYRRKRGPKKPLFKLRPVDYSKGTVLTLLTGGSIVAGFGGYEWISGDYEEFASIYRVFDGVKGKAYYVARGELTNIPEEVMNDDDLEGWDMEIGPLAPLDGTKAVRKVTTENFLA